MSLNVTLTALADIDPLAHEWQELERAANGSFFLSWAWISCWLAHVPAELTPQVLRVRQQDTLIALGLVVQRTVRRYALLRVRAFYLHETGDPRLDEVTIEYNGLLARKGFEAAAAQAVLAFFERRNDWDELYLSGIAPLPALPPSLSAHVSPRQAYHVELGEVCTRGDYLATLSANSKYQMRAALKAYEKGGALRVEAAATTDAALAYLDALIVLHQKYWQGKGREGAFADADFLGFHRRLIAAQYPQGGVQLLRIAAGNDVIGYLYNFVWRGRVYNYQSGFNYDRNDKKKKPGFVCHYLAVQHNLSAGAAIYDFMAGDSQYKRSLSNQAQELWWLTLQKRRWTLMLEWRLKLFKRWLSARIGRRR